MTLNLEQIKEIIPHRDPFLLIDEVTELEPGVRATALKHLTGEEYWFILVFASWHGRRNRLCRAC